VVDGDLAVPVLQPVRTGRPVTLSFHRQSHAWSPHTFDDKSCLALIILLSLFPILSNILLNSSASLSPNVRSASRSLGGVAVLAVLAERARSLLLSETGAARGTADRGDWDAIEDDPPVLLPKEKVRAEERNENGGRGTGVGGAGMSWKGFGFPEAALTSERVSVEEGMVEEELRRAEEAALLYGALVEMELSVQVLLLKFHVRTRP
jgi:hypothetical protein